MAANMAIAVIPTINQSVRGNIVEILGTFASTENLPRTSSLQRIEESNLRAEGLTTND